MIVKRSVVLLLPLLAFIGLLAGCAAAVPSPASPPVHSAAPPTETPMPVTASAPGSRVPLGCDGLLRASSLAAIAGTTPHVYRDQTTAPTNITDIAQDQYGALTCDWSQQQSTISGAELQVSVAPNARAEFKSRFAAIMASQFPSSHPIATENIAGDQSGFWCTNDVGAMGADFNLPICDGELLVSDYWVGIEVDTVNGLTRTQLMTAVPTVMMDIATRLEAAGAAPAQWAAPASTPPGFCTASTSTATVRSIFEDSTLAPAATPSTSTTASAIGLDGPYSACNWRSSSYGFLQIRLLAGGSWAFPSFAPAPIGDSNFAAQHYSTPLVADTSSAKLACVGGLCDAFLAVGSDAVEVDFTDPGVGKRTSVLVGFAKALVES